MKKMILIALLSWSFISCDSNKPTNYPYFTEQYTLEAKYLPSKAFIGLPIQLLVLDSLLIVNEYRQSSELLYFFHRNTGKLLKKNGRVGRGPNEFVAPLYLSVEGDKINIYEKNTFRVFKSTINEELEMKNINQPRSLSSKTQTVNFLASDSLLLTGLFDGLRFSLVDGDGNVKQEFGDYPEIKTIGTSGGVVNLHWQTKAMLFQSNTSIHPEKHKLAVSYGNAGVLELFKSSEGAFKKTNEVVLQRKVRLKHYSSGSVLSAERDDSEPKGFVDITSNNSFIYALYSGKAKKDFKYTNGGEIMVFDWDLNPVSKYVLDESLSHFALDDSNNRIYGIAVKDHEPVIVYFEMP